MNLPFILIKGAGELATAVAHRIVRAGFPVAMTELTGPTCVRRFVSFAQVMFDGSVEVEGITARRVPGWDEAWRSASPGYVPILPAESPDLAGIRPDILVDARVAKRNLDNTLTDAPLVIALGPGIEAGREVHCVIETNRGHHLGRILTSGFAEPDTGVPGTLGGESGARLLRAPAAGLFVSSRKLGDRVAKGEAVATVAGQPVAANCAGLLRGLIADGILVTADLKVGDVDPRCDLTALHTISDKARTISGAVLERVCTFTFRGTGRE